MLGVLILALVAGQGMGAAWAEDSYVGYGGQRRLEQQGTHRKAVAKVRGDEMVLSEELLRLAATAPNPATAALVADLLAAGADPDACCAAGGGSALHEATILDNEPVAVALVESGADVGVTNSYGYTPLHSAAITNAVRVAGVLLEAGAEAGAVDKVGSSPLHIAAEFGSAGVAELLLEAGANSSATNGRGESPKDLTCSRLCPSGAHIKLIELFAQGDLAARGSLDEQLLNVAVSRQNDSTAALVEELLEEGANPNACCTDLGGSALHGTTALDNEAAAVVLVAAGADLDAVDVLGDTPLHVACSGNALAVTKVLINAGADVNATDHFDETPLHVAAVFGRLEHCQLLMAAGADPLVVNVNGARPVDVICEVPCQEDVRAALEDLLMVEDSVSLPPKVADPEEAPTPNPDLGGEEEATDFDQDLLLLAAGPPTPRDLVQVRVDKLLSSGASPDACCLSFGSYALHATTELDNDVVAAALIAAGAEIDPLDEISDTPLHDAAVVNAVAVAELLIDAGADLDARDENGDTPLHHAAQWGSAAVGEMLVKAGADAEAVNGEGLTPAGVLCDSACTDDARAVLRGLLSEDGGGERKRPRKQQKKLDKKLLELAAVPETAAVLEDVADLLEQGADPDACCANAFGGVALHEVSFFDNAGVAAMLVEAGADLESADNFDHTPLHDAAISNAYKVAEVLLEAGADVGAVDFKGDTPLHLAAEWGHAEVAEVLVAGRSDLGAENNAGLTPRDVICTTLCTEDATEGQLQDLLQ